MEELIEKLGIDGKLILAQMVNFAILLFVLKKFVYGPILSMLERREKRVEDARAYAEGIEKKMQEIDETSRKNMQEALSKADALLAEAHERAKQHEREVTASAMERSKKIVEEAQWLARQEKEKAMQEFKKDIGALVAQAAGRMIADTVDAKDKKKMEQEAVNYL
jgi:F-type H+-transporting ATPase subunit b